MKLLIVDDMEGTTGVTDWSQVMADGPDYPRFRSMLTADVNAAIRGAFKGGADEVVVTDGHNYARNIVIQELDPRVTLNFGSPSSLSMVEGVDKGVDAIMFLAYHARAGALNAVLCHTWSLNTTNVWINGRLTGEFGLNGSVAGSFGVAPLMITGDQAVCDEALSWVPDLETVCVKIGNGRYSARCFPAEKTQPMIEETSEKAVRRFINGTAPKPIVTETPVVVRVEFITPNQADGAFLLPNMTRIDGRTLEITAPDMVTAYKSFRAAVSLGR